MTISLTMPQGALLNQLKAAGEQGIFKDTRYTPAENLVQNNFAKWAQRYHNGMGKLVITEAGKRFGT